MIKKTSVLAIALIASVTSLSAAEKSPSKDVYFRPPYTINLPLNFVDKHVAVTLQTTSGVHYLTPDDINNLYGDFAEVFVDYLLSTIKSTPYILFDDFCKAEEGKTFLRDKSGRGIDGIAIPTTPTKTSGIFVDGKPPLIIEVKRHKHSINPGLTKNKDNTFQMSEAALEELYKKTYKRVPRKRKRPRASSPIREAIERKHRVKVVIVISSKGGEAIHVYQALDSADEPESPEIFPLAKGINEIAQTFLPEIINVDICCRFKESVVAYIKKRNPTPKDSDARDKITEDDLIEELEGCGICGEEIEDDDDLGEHRKAQRARK